jgi:hypothetical protein
MLLKFLGNFGNFQELAYLKKKIAQKAKILSIWSPCAQVCELSFFDLNSLWRWRKNDSFSQTVIEISAPYSELFMISGNNSFSPPDQGCQIFLGT